MELPKRPTTKKRRYCLTRAWISGVRQLQVERALLSSLSKVEIAWRSAKKRYAWKAMEAMMRSLPSVVTNPIISTCSYLYQQPLIFALQHAFQAQTPKIHLTSFQKLIHIIAYVQSLPQVRSQGELTFHQTLRVFQLSFPVLLIDDVALSLSVLSDTADEEFGWRLFDALTKGLAVFENSYVFHMPGVVGPISMRISIFEFPLILKLRREKQSVAFGSRQAGDVVADGAVVEDVVRIEDKFVG